MDTFLKDKSKRCLKLPSLLLPWNLGGVDWTHFTLNVWGKDEIFIRLWELSRVRGTGGCSTGGTEYPSSMPL